MKKLFLLFVVVGLAVAAGGAGAQALRSKPSVEKLPNGLTVVMIPWSSPGMVAYYTLVRTGSMDETDKDHTGFAHLFEHMMFRGTKKYPQKAYEEKTQEFGSYNNAFTGFDLTCYTVVGPSEVLGELIGIESDRIRNLDFTEDAFKTETGAVLGEYNLYVSNPELKMEENLLGKAFTRHTYGHTIIGNLDDIKAMPGYYAYSKSFQKRFYVPDNVYIVVAGDFDQQAALEKIKAEYGDWKGKRGVTKAGIEPEQNEARSAHVGWSGPTPPKMTIAYKIPAFSPGPDSAALEVISHLAFGETSPLYRKMVVEEQKVISLEASRGFSSSVSRDPFLFQIDITLKKGTTFDEIQGAVTGAIAEIADGKVSAERIDAVKSHVRYKMVLGFETNKEVASAMAKMLSVTGDAEAIDKYENALREVTYDDVVRAAKTFLTEKRRTTVTMAEEKGGGQ